MGSDLVTMVASSVCRHAQSIGLGIYDILMMSHQYASVLDFATDFAYSVSSDCVLKYYIYRYSKMNSVSIFLK